MIQPLPSTYTGFAFFLPKFTPCEGKRERQARAERKEEEEEKREGEDEKT
jgi:hypothetical protein